MDGRAARSPLEPVEQTRGYRDEYLTLDDIPDWSPEDPSEDLIASTTGAGPLGFTSTATKSRISRASGLTTLAGDPFTTAPTVPMMPRTWGADGNPVGGETTAG
jgi:PPE-repeat protein